MGNRLVIHTSLPGLNDYISAERSNRYKAAKMKRDAETLVAFEIKSQLRGVRFERPVFVRYTWFEKNRRRDKDNVSAFGRKVIQDALVRCGVLKNDGWAQIEGFSDHFFVDAKHPRIEVEIA